MFDTVGRPVAKEVGMGNPAEENDRTPNELKLTDRAPILSRDFFYFFHCDSNMLCYYFQPSMWALRGICVLVEG